MDLPVVLLFVSYFCFIPAILTERYTILFCNTQKFVVKLHMQYTVSDNIRLIREAKGYSQDYVSKKLNVTQQAYSQMEKKPENMTLSRLKALAHVLDVTLISLICEENAYIQHNFNQQGGQAATQMVFHTEQDEKTKVYEDYIQELKGEISFLRGLMSPGKRNAK